MKLRHKITLALSVAMLVTTLKAETVALNFTGTISALNDPDFASLLNTGDPISGALTFDMTTAMFMPVFPVSGGFSLPAGLVSGPFPTGMSTASTGGAMIWVQWGTGPTAMVGGYQRTIEGLEVVMSLNGFTATLSDYLALHTSDFMMGVGGRSDWGWSETHEWVADVRLTSASLTLVGAVPDGGSTALLLLSSLLALSLRRQRNN